MSRRIRLPKTLVPMLAQPADLPANDDQFAFELKWDGERALVFCDRGQVKLLTRNGKDITATYPELQALGRRFRTRSAVLDGEIIALDAKGRPSFEVLQNRLGLKDEVDIAAAMQQTPVAIMLFDLLALDGESLLALPYTARRRHLQRLKLAGKSWATPAYETGQGQAMLKTARKLGMEGVMAKKLDSPYRLGQRTADWRKIKIGQRQEFVVAGYTAGTGRRGSSFGALLVGVYDYTAAEAKRRGVKQRLLYAGGVGSGFDEDRLAELVVRLRRLATTKPAFTNPDAIPNTVRRATTFVKPQLVAEVEFYEWTSQGQLRHPVFLGLRRDKPARDVIRERISRAVRSRKK